MKLDKWKEILSIILSLILALAVFIGLFIGLQWRLILCMDLAAAVYFALTLILKPIARIGKVEVSSLNHGEALHEKLQEAAEDYARMKRAAQQISDLELKQNCMKLVQLAERILQYLTKNPQKIPSARRYIDYYQETAANVMEHYVELEQTGLSTAEAQSALHHTKESVGTLYQAFQMQFEKLMQNELMDMEADLNLLKQTLQSEGYQEKEKR